MEGTALSCFMIWGTNSRIIKREKSKLLCCLGSLIFFMICSSSFLLAYFYVAEKSSGSDATFKSNLCTTASVPNGTLCCDRSSIRTDVCVMKGDVRADPATSSVALYTSHISTGGGDETLNTKQEKIRPYTRKWETKVMDTIDELDLVVKPDSASHRCDVRHSVPAVIFSTGGYTGNVYHEFNDGILPLYITSHRMKKRVVFVILEYHQWWMTKYSDVLSQFTDFPVIDFNHDPMVHCFPEAVIGLQIHGELTIDPELMANNESMVSFHDLIGQAYQPRIRTLIHNERNEQNITQPKLVLISRNGSRSIRNQDALVKMAAEMGFRVQILTPQKTSQLAEIYHVLNSSDVVVGVHGAAMTHLIFMKPRSVLVQIIPLGTDGAAEAYYGEPARKFGLKYIGYKILPKESSLYDKYDKKDPVLVDPSSINSKGWEFTKKIYLDHQTVRLNLSRFRKQLQSAYDYHKRRMDQEVS